MPSESITLRIKSMPYSIEQLNQLSQAEFVKVLGGVFENTPAIARDVWHQRPFQDIDDLHQKMIEIVKRWESEDQLDLIRAHPDLGSRVKMADSSIREQASAGLNRLTMDEYDRLVHLNRLYQEKFGFPFVMAVRNHTKISILKTFEQRLKNSVEQEHAQAIAEIAQISHSRLLDLVE